MPRKGENIYKRKDGRWEGRYLKPHAPGAKVRYGYVYAKTYREVKAKLNDAICQLPAAAVEKNTACFALVSRDWLQNKTAKVKAATGNRYFNLLHSYILPELGNLELSVITPERLESLCEALLLHGGKEQTGLSAKTVADVLSVIRSVLQYALQKGFSVSCDARRIHVKQQTGKMRVLTRGEQEMLYQNLRAELTPGNIGILLSLFTGLRVGEVCALRWEDLSFADQTLRVHQTMQRIQVRDDPAQKTKVVITPPKSACSIRTIPFPDLLVPLLIQHRTATEGYVLTNSPYKLLEPRTLQNSFQRTVKKYAIQEINFHALRHTFATRCIELGFDVKSLSEILGHASVNITMNRYVHPSMELKKANMQKLSELYAVE